MSQHLNFTNIKQSLIPKPYFSGSNVRDTKRYCNLLKNNTTASKFSGCDPDPCYYTAGNLQKMPWMLKSVRPTDHAQFSINNRISGGNIQYFGGEYNRLHYSSYKQFQSDPTWD